MENNKSEPTHALSLNVCIVPHCEGGGRGWRVEFSHKSSQERGETTPIFTIAKSNGWFHSTWDQKLNWANQPIMHEHSNVNFLFAPQQLKDPEGTTMQVPNKETILRKILHIAHRQQHYENKTTHKICVKQQTLTSLRRSCRVKPIRGKLHFQFEAFVQQGPQLISEPDHSLFAFEIPFKMTKWTARGSGHVQQFYSTPVATQVCGMAWGWAGFTLGFKQTTFRRGALDMLHSAGWRVSTPRLHTIKHI